MSKRVSVDAEALNDFINSARGDMETVISEFCAKPSEESAARRSFNEELARLDIQDL